MADNAKCNDAISIIANECQDVGMEYLEIGIDALLDDKVLSEIPAVKSVYALIKMPITLWNAYNMKKIIYFCYYMKDIPSHKRISFVNKAINEDKNFGEKLMLCIDKIDDLEKVKMLKMLFQAYGHRDGINYDTFRRLCIIIINTYAEDLKYIKQVHEREIFGGINALALVSSGLAQLCIIDCNPHKDTDELYCLTSLAHEFYECVFTEKYSVVY